jgi:hypothetical protein
MMGFLFQDNCNLLSYVLFNLPPGKYIVMVAYPDGTNKEATNFQVEQGTAHNLDFKY